MRKLINVMIVFLLILGPLVKTNQIEESTSRLVFFSSQASLDYCDNETRKLTWSEAGIATSADGPFDIFAADMDNDGDIDILSASENDDTIAWYENDGASDPRWTASDLSLIHI